MEPRDAMDLRKSLAASKAHNREPLIVAVRPVETVMESVRNTELATRRPQSVSWRLWLAASLVILGLASCAGWYASGYMPGTLRLHTGARRVEAWGTGVHAIKYSTGAIQSQH